MSDFRLGNMATDLAEYTLDMFANSKRIRWKFMSRTIKDLDLGTEIQIKENNSYIPYILIKKDLQGCVVLRADCSELRRMNPTNTTVYENSEADTYLNDSETGYLSRFDADTYSCITARSISTHNYGDTESRSISRRCFLLSQGELFNDTATAIEPETGITPALMIFKQTSNLNTARIAQYGGSAINWWLRSPSSATYFYFVNGGGSSGSSGASGAGCALRPALNVAPATIVSDEGADTIYLQPSATTRTVQFSGKVLETYTRPTKGLVKYKTYNLQNVSVQICNNYGDTNPVWVDATDMQEVTFTNTSKETTDWQIGVKCYGESLNYGYFKEPVVLVEVE